MTCAIMMNASPQSDEAFRQNEVYLCLRWTNMPGSGKRRLSPREDGPDSTARIWLKHHRPEQNENTAYLITAWRSAIRRSISDRAATIIWPRSSADNLARLTPATDDDIRLMRRPLPLPFGRPGLRPLFFLPFLPRAAMPWLPERCRAKCAAMLKPLPHFSQVKFDLAI